MISSHKYELADESFVVNDNDPDLTPIRISLPKPPPLELIDGYGLPPLEQRFKRMEIPPKLARLKQVVLKKLEEKRTRNKKYIITLWKLQQEFWDTLEKERDYYEKEIEFIKRLWWHRLYGYWFFNKGKPTYISGWHFYYLNFWYMPDVKPDNYPHYRDRDRKEFLFHKYAHETTETFRDIDDEGWAVKNEAGKYEMIDLGRRVSYGLVQSKNRRSGNTNKGLCINMELVTRTIGTDGAGIMSYTGDNAESHFKTKLIPAWDRMPMFFMPMCISPNNASQIIFSVPSGEYGVNGLQTGITYASTANAKFYDGKKLISALLDEEGKCEQLSVAERWQVIMHCLSQGNGAIIHGYSYHPSTVEEYTSGGAEYKVLSDKSSFYQRLKSNGQTPSGLFRIFVPGDEGLDGYIDSYGLSVRGVVKDYQRAEGFEQTATDYLQGIRDHYLKIGTPEAMSDYRAQKKLFPLQYSDSWLGDTGDVGFDIEIIDEALANCHRKKETIRGNFEWEGGIFGAKVIWVPNEEGRWEVSNLFERRANQRTRDTMMDPITQEIMEVWSPYDPGFGTIGIDPFKFKTKAEVKANTYSKHGMSDGGMTGIWEFDATIDDRNARMSEWKSFDVIFDYLFRPATDDEFAEDALKSCIWYGMMAYPEMNLAVIYKKFREWGYMGYLKYDVSSDGVVKSEPGSHMYTQSKQEGFSLARNFIKLRGLKIKHERLLKQCKSIQSADDLQHHDLLASFILALLGTRSMHAKAIQQHNESMIDISGIIKSFKY